MWARGTWGLSSWGEGRQELLAFHGAGQAADDALLEDGEEDQRGQHGQ
jgi:hypothetical protein